MSTATTLHTFDDVASHYDGQANPLLALEERYLSPLLPSIRDLDVVEVGCGTGRWLARLRAKSASSLAGVDPSRNMLSEARKKLGDSARLVQGTADRLPYANDSADLILLPFVLSYCPDLENVAREVARIARPGATVFVSDVHPETEADLSWRRTFASDAGTVEMATARHRLAEVVRHFERAGFDCAVRLEVSFGSEEAATFALAGKLDALRAIGELPAIYILQFVSPLDPAIDGVRYAGGRLALDSKTTVASEIGTSAGKVSAIGAWSDGAAPSIDLSGCMILPGLINAHDHLEFGLYPNLGRGDYANATEWAHDIHRREKAVIGQHERVPKEVRLYFGALRNLLSGVTTVCHHNPEAAVFREPAFPVHVLRDINWAHSLAFDRTGVERHARSERIFAVHAAEGKDRAALLEIKELERLGALHSRAVLVHALGCGESDVEQINRQDAAVVVCPTSNRFLYGRVLSAECFRKLRRVALGTDSPLTSRGNLLDEMQYAREAWQASDEKLYSMCTSAPANIFDLQDGSGSLRVDGRADFLVVRDNGAAPAKRLAALTENEIELVIVAGSVHLSSDSMYRVLPKRLQAGLAPLLVEGVRRWVRAPLRWMFEEARAVLGDVITVGGKRVSYAG